MTQPTAAAMRAAVKLDQIWGHDGDEVTRRCASEIDNATGLPELIAACAFISEFWSCGNTRPAYYEMVREALRIAREGRS